MSSGFQVMRMSVRGSLEPSGQRRWCLLHRRRKSRGTDPLCPGGPTWRLLFAPGDGDGHDHGGDGVLYRNEDAGKLDGHQSPRDNAL